MMSREAKQIIGKLLELDPRRRYKASDLMREQWVKCNDMQLSIFETAGTLFRANSMDRTSTSVTSNYKGSHHQERVADGFNHSIAKIHHGAIEHLRTVGFSSRAIEDSMKLGEAGAALGQTSQIYKIYKEQINS